MINCCNEIDCPLHKDNENKKKALQSIDAKLKLLENNVANIQSLNKITNLLIIKNELTASTPKYCLSCIYFQKLDMKSEIIVSLAKNALLNQDD